MGQAYKWENTAYSEPRYPVIYPYILCKNSKNPIGKNFLRPFSVILGKNGLDTLQNPLKTIYYAKKSKSPLWKNKFYPLISAESPIRTWRKHENSPYNHGKIGVPHVTYHKNRGKNRNISPYSP